MEVKKALTVFHYAEKIKSNLILAAKLLESLGNMKQEELAGAEKMFAAYLNAFISEVNIAANASGVKEFRDVSAKLDEAAEQTLRHEYSAAMKLISEAISITTTSGSGAAEVLKENNLI
ncbi:MAG: hypothetical protein ACPL0C_02410 [Candidatus Bathyarchaeales archaeon]